MEMPNHDGRSDDDRRADDRFWHAALERIGHASDAPLDPLERELLSIDAPELTATEVDAVLAALPTSPAVEWSSARTRASRRGLRVAVVLLVAAMSTAAVVAPLLFWPEQRDSANTMNFAVALELLRHPDQPLDSRQSALLRINGRVREVVRTLQTARAAAESPAELRVASAQAIRDLAVLIGDPVRGVPAPQPTESDLQQALAMTLDPSLDATLRSQAARLLGHCAATGIVAIRDAITTMPDLATELELTRNSLIGLVAE